MPDTSSQSVRAVSAASPDRLEESGTPLVSHCFPARAVSAVSVGGRCAAGTQSRGCRSLGLSEPRAVSAASASLEPGCTSIP